eukprot:gb/GECH01010959.1/.p1 GENE.gb/GECH01010959.1/~~gb/GECH01010959.1/.p1  ORF type:complete len:214 (+),score=44.26 gb/GECH01010959.1/:1-642(+)
MWDIPGDTEYNELRPMIYRNTDIFIFCFDLSRRESLKKLKTKWNEEIRHHCSHAGIVVWGSKFDLLKRKKPHICWINTKYSSQNHTLHQRQSWRSLFRELFSFLSFSFLLSIYSSSTRHSDSSDNVSVSNDDIQESNSDFSTSDVKESSQSLEIFNQIPDEVLIHIIDYCSIYNVNQWCQVNRRWYQCLASDSVWEKLYNRELKDYYENQEIS